MSFSSVSTPKARKVHRCQWCQEPILKGEVHVKFSGIYDGDFYSGRHHNECEAAWHRYSKREDEYPSFTKMTRGSDLHPEDGEGVAP